MELVLRMLYQLITGFNVFIILLAMRSIFCVTLSYWHSVFHPASYYTSAKTATVEDFLNSTLLDSLGVNLNIAFNITLTECNFLKPIRMTETSSCYGGGAKGLSDAYVAGFM